MTIHMQINIVAHAAAEGAGGVFDNLQLVAITVAVGD
jgi:hypothetical protein